MFKVSHSVQQNDKVASIYFSKENMDALQHGIRYRVFKESGGKYTIDNQSEQELVIVMRSIYFEYAAIQRNYGVLEEVRRLNGMVLDYAVPQILNEIEMRNKYMYDVSHLPTVLNHAQNTSVKGENSLEMKPFF